MKRFALLVAIVASGACNTKPTADECRAAIVNMEKVLGTEASARNVDVEGEVRRCRGGSSKAAVTCATKAATLEDLKACAFMSAKTPSAAPAEPAAPAAPGGSGATAGSGAASGSGAPAEPSNK